MGNPYFVGVYGGTARGSAAVVGADGKVVARALGNRFDANQVTEDEVDLEAARAALSGLLADLDKASSLPAAGAKRVVIGLNGLDGDAPPPFVSRLLDGILDGDVRARTRVTDATAATRLCAEEGPAGLTVIASAQSSVTFRGADGTAASGLGWGRPIEDPLSAIALALDGLRAIVGEWETTAPKTELTAALFKFADVDNRTDASEEIRRIACDVPKLCAFGHEVALTARQGDRIARQIVDQHVDRLVHRVSRMLLQYPLATDVWLWGSVFMTHKWIRMQFARGLLRLNRKLVINVPELPCDLANAIAAAADAGVATGGAFMAAVFDASRAGNLAPRPASTQYSAQPITTPQSFGDGGVAFTF